MQSYQNVSNSQLTRFCYVKPFSCKRLCKVIKMLAIHNVSNNVDTRDKVANAYAKLSKCQQFTTFVYNNQLKARLQTLMQSYQNVSNSQLFYFFHLLFKCCKRLCKVIKMLAIHNWIQKIYQNEQVANAYAKLSKCQQFTTTTHKATAQAKLQTLMQSYQNVSNSQLRVELPQKLIGCKRFCKVIKMLAIHNSSSIFKDNFLVANAFAKLSKCQQFTTSRLRTTTHLQLQTLLQSYQNVSNSQLIIYL